MKKNTTSERVSFTDGYRAPDNAKAVKENNTAGINRVVKLSAVINGEIISSFKHFKLKQSTVTHHEFELTLAHDALSEKQGHQLEQANAFLGKRLTIKITYKDFETKNSPERVFVGIITKVGFSQEAHSLGNIVLKGFSPTILLDGSPHTQSFGGSQPVNTGIIADEVIKQGIDPFWYDFRVNAQASSQIVYSSQYNETHYNYLCRLAEAYGEQFFYDGEVLHFGNMPAPAAPLELISGSNASNIHTELRALHTQPGYYGYNSSKNTMLTSGETPLRHMGSLAQTAYSNNQGIFKTPSLQPAPIRAATDMDVVNSQTGAWGSKGVDVFVVSGDTTMPFLYPGCTADLYLRKPDSSKTGYFTKLMMTEVTHEIDTLGHYKGSFEAIASDTGFIPKPEFTTPFAETQPAVVVSNEDPLGQGRVKVKFLWQLNETTDFIRVMSPDAGGTDQITQNRGYVAIPEVGDQVMVGFVHNHPDRPFVMGGMFHGGVALGGGVNNHLKSIQTRSGIRILMNDAEGSVNIVDPSGNNYFMDGKGNITVSAPNDINLNAGGNLNINVGQNMSTSVGMNKTDTVTMNHSESVGMIKTSSVIGDSQVFITGKLTEFIEGDVHSEVKQERNEISRKEMNFSTEENFTSHTKSSIYMNSGEKGHNH